MQLSFIIATRNRDHAVAACLDSISASIAAAAPLEAEIVIVDNGSTDETASVIERWVRSNAIPVQYLFEPLPGRSRANNRALRAAKGQILAFTDDDCQVSHAYVSDLLRHHGQDDSLVLRGGRIDLGDPSDLPLTIYTGAHRQVWHRETKSLIDFVGKLNGCNMSMNRSVYETVGPFDERLGPGAFISSGEDTDFLYRAFLAGVTLEYVPDMGIFHHHGRKTPSQAHALMRDYVTANGALYLRYCLRCPRFCRHFYWDCKAAIAEIISRKNTFAPLMNFSYRDKVIHALLGAARYAIMPVLQPRRPPRRTPGIGP